MKFEDFELHAEPFFSSVSCKKCRNDCKIVGDGWFSKAFYCPKDNIVYQLKLIKMKDKDINKEYLKELEKEFNPK